MYSCYPGHPGHPGHVDWWHLAIGSSWQSAGLPVFCLVCGRVIGSWLGVAQETCRAIRREFVASANLPVAGGLQHGPACRFPSQVPVTQAESDRPLAQTTETSRLVVCVRVPRCRIKRGQCRVFRCRTNENTGNAGKRKHVGSASGRFRMCNHAVFQCAEAAGDPENCCGAYLSPTAGNGSARPVPGESALSPSGSSRELQLWLARCPFGRELAK